MGLFDKIKSTLKDTVNEKLNELGLNENENEQEEKENVEASNEINETVSDDRPTSVSKDAEWNDANGEWEVGSYDDNGYKIGEWKWWREDGTVCCITNFEEDSNEKSFSFTRFHEDGTYSQKGAYVNGAQQGTLYYQGSENNTSERVMEGVPNNIYKYEIDWENGKAVARRQWDKNGTELDTNGGLLNPIKPNNIPENAIWNRRNQEWEMTSYNKIGEPINSHKYWRANGSLFEEIKYVDGLKNEVRKYHPSGNLANEVLYQEGALLIESRTMIDEENSDIEFPKGNLPEGVIKKTYTFDPHGFMTGWKGYNQENELIIDEQLNLNMNGSLVQTTYDSIEAASEEWNQKGDSYFKDMNYFVDQFYIENHPRVDYEPQDERGHMEKYIIEQLEKLNQSNQTDKLRELFKPSIDPISDQFWMATGKRIENLVVFNNHLYTTVNHEVYKIEENDIILEDGLIFIGASQDKEHIVKCTTSNIIVVNASSNETIFAFDYPKNYGQEVQEKFPNLTTGVFENPKNLHIKDVTFALDQSSVILTTLEGTFKISENGSSLIFPYFNAMDQYITERGEENFTIGMNYNYTTLSNDEKYIFFTAQVGNQDAMTQTKEVVNENGFTFKNKKFDATGYEICPSFFNKNNQLIHGRYQPAQGYGQGGDKTFMLLSDLETIGDESQSLVTDDTPVIFSLAGEIQSFSEVNDEIIAATNKKYIWKGLGNGNKLEYCFLGGSMNNGNVTSMELSPDQSKVYIGTDFGNIFCFSFLDKDERGKNLLTNMNIKDEKRYLFLHSFEPMVW